MVNCSDPGHVENGVRQSGLHYPEIFSYGVTVAIHCKRGFYLLGSALLTCQHDGLWDRPTPRCLGTDGQMYCNYQHREKQWQHRFRRQMKHKQRKNDSQRAIMKTFVLLWSSWIPAEISLQKNRRRQVDLFLFSLVFVRKIHLKNEMPWGAGGRRMRSEWETVRMGEGSREKMGGN